MALLLPPLRGGDRRGPPLDVAGERQRRPPDLRVRPARLDPDVDVDPARAGRLRPADEPDGLERLAGDERDLADLRPRRRPAPGRGRPAARRGGRGPRPGPGAGSGRCSRGWRPRRGRPRRRGRSRRRSGRTGTSASRSRSQSGRLSGARFWKNASPSAPSTKRLSAIGRPPSAAQRAVGDREVVLDEVELRVAGLREVDLVRVRDRDLAAGDLEDLLARRHGRNDTAVGRGYGTRSISPGPTISGPARHAAGAPALGLARRGTNLPRQPSLERAGVATAAGAAPARSRPVPGGPGRSPPPRSADAESAERVAGHLDRQLALGVDRLDASADPAQAGRLGVAVGPDDQVDRGVRGARPLDGEPRGVAVADRDDEHPGRAGRRHARAARGSLRRRRSPGMPRARSSSMCRRSRLITT